VCEKLRTIELPGVEVFVEPVRDYRFVLVLRPNGKTELSDAVADADPEREGVPVPEPRALRKEAEPTARLLHDFIAGAKERLNGSHPANGLTLRGIARHPKLPRFPDVFGLRAGAVAVYPMYRGLAKLVGMTVLPTGSTYADEIETVRKHWDEFDFFFIHYKPADSPGEDGDYDAKVQALTAFDGFVSELRELAPDVLMIAGDHSTPAVIAGHSWHPVPFLLHSNWGPGDDVDTFHERACLRGALGIFPATDVMPLAMANAQRFAKYGA
jgi:2,3-bisphosphoglycerate-independent phosphoglycerate mutase